MDQVDIAEFLKVGLGVLVATRSEQLVPNCVAGAALILTGPEQAVVFLPEYEAAPAIANVSANGAIAAVIEQPTTHRGIQLKGRATVVRDTTPGEAEAVAAFVGRTLELTTLREGLTRDPSVTCVVATGLGGVGKTSLVHHFVATEAKELFEEAAWVDARDLWNDLGRVAGPPHRGRLLPLRGPRRPPRAPHPLLRRPHARAHHAA